MIEKLKVGSVLYTIREFHIPYERRLMLSKSINSTVIIPKNKKYVVEVISSDGSTFAIRNDITGLHYFDEKYLTGRNKLFETITSNRLRKIESLKL